MVAGKALYRRRCYGAEVCCAMGATAMCSYGYGSKRGDFVTGAGTWPRRWMGLLIDNSAVSSQLSYLLSNMERLLLGLAPVRFSPSPRVVCTWDIFTVIWRCMEKAISCGVCVCACAHTGGTEMCHAMPFLFV